MYCSGHDRSLKIPSLASAFSMIGGGQSSRAFCCEKIWPEIHSKEGLFCRQVSTGRPWPEFQPKYQSKLFFLARYPLWLGCRPKHFLLPRLKQVNYDQPGFSSKIFPKMLPLSPSMHPYCLGGRSTMTGAVRSTLLSQCCLFIAMTGDDRVRERREFEW